MIKPLFLAFLVACRQTHLHLIKYNIPRKINYSLTLITYFFRDYKGPKKDVLSNYTRIMPEKLDSHDVHCEFCILELIINLEKKVKLTFKKISFS